MDYSRTVQNRIAVDFNNLRLPVSMEDALQLLARKNIHATQLNIIDLAMLQHGKPYELRARMEQAPHCFDCSTFTKWIYGLVGVWLPRRTIQQRQMGSHVDPSDLIPGDLVFKTSDRINWYLDDPADNVGHVGIFIGGERVIHCVYGKGVVSGPLSCFTHPQKYRRARRLIPDPEHTYTLILPKGSGVEIADDIKWIILSSLAPTEYNIPGHKTSDPSST